MNEKSCPSCPSCLSVCLSVCPSCLSVYLCVRERQRETQKEQTDRQTHLPLPFWLNMIISSRTGSDVSGSSSRTEIACIKKNQATIDKHTNCYLRCHFGSSEEILERPGSMIRKAGPVPDNWEKRETDRRTDRQTAPA